MDKQKQLQEMAKALGKRGFDVVDTSESSMSVTLETGFTNTYTESARIEMTDEGYRLSIETKFIPFAWETVELIIARRIEDNKS